MPLEAPQIAACRARRSGLQVAQVADFEQRQQQQQGQQQIVIHIFRSCYHATALATAKSVIIRERFKIFQQTLASRRPANKYVRPLTNRTLFILRQARNCDTLRVAHKCLAPATAVMPSDGHVGRLRPIDFCDSTVPLLRPLGTHREFAEPVLCVSSHLVIIVITAGRRRPLIQLLSL